MNRIDPKWHNTRPKHERLSLDLLNLIVQFEMTIKFGEVPCYALRQNMINLISSGREEIELCTTTHSDMIKRATNHSQSIMEERYPNHMEMIMWLNEMSVACKLANLPPLEISKIISVTNKPVDVTRLTDLQFLVKGSTLINELDNCRVSLRETGIGWDGKYDIR